MNGPREYQHPFIIRFTHWLNFVALGIMVTSGLRIYNASPVFEFKIPSVLTLGGWLAGARQWHFFAMWLFLVNGMIWLLYNIMSKHGRQTTIFSINDINGVLPIIKYYLRVQKEHPPSIKYNSLQKAAYTTIPVAALGAILTGIAIYWPVQFKWITSLFGNYDSARAWHFMFMAVLVLFFFGHLFMVTISGWANFLSMITGWKNKGYMIHDPLSNSKPET